MWFIGVEVKQETSAPPPKKNPGSAPALFETTTILVVVVLFFLNIYLRKQRSQVPCIFLMDGDGKPVQATETEHIYSCFKHGLMIKKLLNKEIFKIDRQGGPKILPSSSHDSGEVRWEGKQEIFWNAPCLTTFLVFQLEFLLSSSRPCRTEARSSELSCVEMLRY